MLLETLLAPAFLLLCRIRISAAANLPTEVNLRVEGPESTIFEGVVVTTGHNVTTVESGGTHHCDGTNNGENVYPGATCTSALDDAAAQEGFSWDGTFSTQFDDYFVTSIGGSTQTDSAFWGLLMDFEFTLVGGCQQQISDAATQEVLWAFDAFNAVHFLKLSGPASATVGIPAVFSVTDGATMQPVAGAAVDESGATTGTDGTVEITFTTVGLNIVKAQLAGSVRSNKVDVVIA